MASGKKKNTPDEAGEKPKRKRARYVSPSYLEISCPRCGGPNHVPTGTKGAIQYRQCRSGTCRHSFKVARRRILSE